MPGDLPHEMPGYVQINLLVRIKQSTMQTAQQGVAFGAVALCRYPSAGSAVPAVHGSGDGLVFGVHHKGTLHALRKLEVLDVMSDPLRQLDLTGTPVACPVCGRVHERCRFTAGSLYCTRPDCQNPHHRRPPPHPSGTSGRTPPWTGSSAA